ncbi:MAG: bifunctional diaminohydroxyphosphoribosylaminopyrimidine deaminase/5-amino-6-(5-phosphoribosylamino)uracil reductase RibD [Acidimicrobiales bacterium]|jgi:diaminohydroxyphosphoribosylaminopyrimidine deaminase/5-amino-6-(5-phosphoribosylamino)uracil reductase|nr:bifunctional diaminohydroxyphosphoribosylaminopyrimidine deaminase/5-amino-6-(5-phosphoribosylamino)uracil reductase RibD [Acidimicrobiales bacterium]|tara:strand:- start:1375 stop:2376 length:1002 start_codon:yes stop_codon:yes gene_type:complete
METDATFMTRAIEVAERARYRSSPNPWVGAVVVADGCVVGTGATSPPGGAHAEVVALADAGDQARGATLYTTLEPCCHEGKTAPCTSVIAEAGISRVVAAVTDPDPDVAGGGFAALAEARIGVDAGIEAGAVEEQLLPYLTHRRTGLPYVVLKLAATLDGRIAATDGSSTWITGPEARQDVHRLRAQSDAICVGAGTIRADDPRLTVRDWPGAEAAAARDPRRVVLGAIPEGAEVMPAESHEGPLEDLLVDLAGDGVLQLLVEGGADVAGRFHRAGLVDRYVIYIAPAILGGDDSVPMMTGPGGTTMADVARGSFTTVIRLGGDLRIDMVSDT